MWWVPNALADALPPLPHAAEVPELRWYGKVDVVAGRVVGKYRRRRDGEHELSVLPDGLVVRWLHTTREAALDHQMDAAGRSWATVRLEGGAPVTVTAHGPADEETDVRGWSWVGLPGGGALWAPSGASTGDTAEGPLLGGAWTAALRPRTDPFAAAFAEGLLDGCRCDLFDRGTVWVDGHPGARHALAIPAPGDLPGGAPAALVEVWAVPRGDQLLVLTWRVDAPADPVATSRRGRALAALVDFDRTPGGGS